MTIFIGADHRGFELKNKLVEYLQEQNIRVEDLGNFSFEPLDDAVDFTQKVTQAVLQNPGDFRGIIVCGSGIAATIAANRHKGIYCALGFDRHQIEHGRQNDHINVLALPSEYLNFEQAQLLVDVFLQTKTKSDEKYIRRIKKLDI
ncbi:RpiB/LacA/LacB family sugar-phosphate isomerase [Candidatus Roizmanbacteria bacterium]|nr:RpiB/LacA/LacB family sugar-phosphate isomerase [Candidatus Roizmanbacteria bacterium]